MYRKRLMACSLPPVGDEFEEVSLFRTSKSAPCQLCVSLKMDDYAEGVRDYADGVRNTP